MEMLCLGGNPRPLHEPRFQICYQPNLPTLHYTLPIRTQDHSPESSPFILRNQQLLLRIATD